MNFMFENVKTHKIQVKGTHSISKYGPRYVIKEILYRLHAFVRFTVKYARLFAIDSFGLFTDRFNLSLYTYQELVTIMYSEVRFTK